MKFKALHTVAYSSLVLMAACVGIFMVWTFSPHKVIDVLNNRVPVRPDTINPEDTVIVSPYICKHIKARAEITRTLVSTSTKILLPDYPNMLPIGCHKYDLPVIIPGLTPDGVYHLEYVIVYRVNPITEDIERWQTQDFTVKHVPPLAQESTVVTPVAIPLPQPAPEDQTTNTVPSPVQNQPVKQSGVAKVLTKIANLIGGILK